MSAETELSDLPRRLPSDRGLERYPVLGRRVVVGGLAAGGVEDDLEAGVVRARRGDLAPALPKNWRRTLNR